MESVKRSPDLRKDLREDLRKDLREDLRKDLREDLVVVNNLALWCE